MDFEQYKIDIKKFFEDNLKTYIDAINIIKTDIEIPYPDKYYLNQYPMPNHGAKINVYIIADDFIVEPYSNKSKIIKNDIEIYYTIKGFDTDIIKKIEDRFKEAFYNLINEKNTLNGLADISYITTIKSFDGIENTMLNITEIKISNIKYTN